MEFGVAVLPAQSPTRHTGHSQPFACRLTAVGGGQRLAVEVGCSALTLTWEGPLRVSHTCAGLDSVLYLGVSVM